jgi:hypothetical protein
MHYLFYKKYHNKYYPSERESPIQIKESEARSQNSAFLISFWLLTSGSFSTQV